MPAPPCGEEVKVNEEEDCVQRSSPSLLALQDQSSSKVRSVGCAQGVVPHLQGICTLEGVDAGGQKPPGLTGCPGEERGPGVLTRQRSPEHLPLTPRVGREGQEREMRVKTGHVV